MTAEEGSGDEAVLRRSCGKSCLAQNAICRVPVSLSVHDKYNRIVLPLLASVIHALVVWKISHGYKFHSRIPQSSSYYCSSAVVSRPVLDSPREACNRWHGIPSLLSLNYFPRDCRRAKVKLKSRRQSDARQDPAFGFAGL